jgi:hypothetical protein
MLRAGSDGRELRADGQNLLVAPPGLVVTWILELQGVSMNSMNNRSIFDDEARAGQVLCLAYRYGTLVFILALLAFAILHYLHSPPGRDPYRGFGLPLMLLFSHLALAFKWRRPAAVALYVLSASSLVLGLFYAFCLSHVLFPRQ